MLDFITMCDGYKLDHRRQYPNGTRRVYSNWTARSSRVQFQKSVVFFGLDYFLRRYLTEIAEETFFSRDKDSVLLQYDRMLQSYLGPNKIGVDHIAALHDLGYIPLKFYALPEGSLVPLRMPMFTFENTHDDFFWVTNYIETMLSAVLWLPCTSATTAFRYRNLLNTFAEMSGVDLSAVDWQGHDFSFRGMSNPEAAALSGAAHLLSFTGTDSIPAIQLLEEYYHAEGLIAGSVPATEHSVMCAGGRDCEVDTFERILDLYPTGIVSVVSDTWDLWAVIGDMLPTLKDKIMKRDGKLVIRPDSGNPADILCGDRNALPGSFKSKGVIECLWDIFGGTRTPAGLKVLDSHIGAIYGDSITEARASEICERLFAKGFVSTSVVFGIGSYTYQYVTRDVYGFAVKATWADVNGEERLIYKDPATDNGEKKSARGRIAITSNANGQLIMTDGLSLADHKFFGTSDLLEPVWENGRFRRNQSLAMIRERVARSLDSLKTRGQ